MSDRTFDCPKGHDSTEPDYCSECGAKIDAALAAAVDAAGICPDCGTSRMGHARYCEVCRYDFAPEPEPAAPVPVEPALAAVVLPDPPSPPPPVAPPPPPVAPPPPPPPPLVVAPADEPEPAEDLPPLWPLPLAFRQPGVGSTPTQSSTSQRRPPRPPAPAAAPPTPVAAEPAAPKPPPAPVPSDLQRLWVAVRVDPTLVTSPDPDNPCPVDTAERVFPLDLAETLVGRRSQLKDVNPEIPVADSGISRRHLTFLRRPDGGFSVLDLNSTNGSKLNGFKLEAGVETPIRAGDELVLGEWTRLIIRKR